MTLSITYSTSPSSETLRSTIMADPLAAEHHLILIGTEDGTLQKIGRQLTDGNLATATQHAQANGWKVTPDCFSNIAQQITSYLAGDLTTWDAKLHMIGSPFRTKSWHALATTSHGETISYQQLAERAGNAKAFRAAASGCATNPIPLIVPCHRILAKGGKIGGFRWGLDYKRRLLALEQSCDTMP